MCVCVCVKGYQVRRGAPVRVRVICHTYLVMHGIMQVLLIAYYESRRRLFLDSQPEHNKGTFKTLQRLS